MSTMCHLAFIEKVFTLINDMLLNKAINIHENPFYFETRQA